MQKINKQINGITPRVTSPDSYEILIVKYSVICFVPGTTIISWLSFFLEFCRYNLLERLTCNFVGFLYLYLSWVLGWGKIFSILMGFHDIWICGYKVSINKVFRILIDSWACRSECHRGLAKIPYSHSKRNLVLLKRTLNYMIRLNHLELWAGRLNF